MKSVILAAGFGTRIRNFQENVPKPLIKIGKKTILEHLLSTQLEAGMTDFIILLGYQGERIQDFISENWHNSDLITFVNAEKYEFGPLFTFLNAENHILDENFLVTPADLFLDSQLMKEFLKYTVSDEITIAVDELSSRSKSKVFIEPIPGSSQVEEGSLLGFNELILTKRNYLMRTPIPLLHCTKNVFIHARKAVDFGKTRLIEALNIGIKSGLFIRSIKFKGYFWQDMDSPEDIKQIIQRMKLE
ncbi:MAG: nucleotidyltransferase family protein [Candidatus Helarchaeota archaeon]